MCYKDTAIGDFMEKTVEITTIQISKETRERLKRAGCKGETYEKIIKRLLTGQEGVRPRGE